MSIFLGVQFLWGKAQFLIPIETDLTLSPQTTGDGQHPFDLLLERRREFLPMFFE